jgi:predicted amidohydrolase
MMDLALVQLDIAAGDIDGNVERALDGIETAADRGADLIVLPELFTVGYFAFEEYAASAESLEGPVLSRIQAVARERAVTILAGSVVEDLAASHAAGYRTPATDGFANTAVLFAADGSRAAVYRKQHLFGYDSAEQERLVPGERLETAAVGGFTVGLTTCYDLRFPELYRRLVDRDVTLVLVPSAWPEPRVEHWNLLPRARAVENQCYVATANGVGECDGATLLGRSAVYGPWGTIRTRMSGDAGITVVDIDPARAAAVREEFPALADRREP